MMSEIDEETIESALPLIENDEPPIEDEDVEQKGTLLSTVVNLCNNIVGAGILSLPSCFKDSSILEGSLLIIFIGILNGLSMILIAISCDIMGCYSFRELGQLTLGKDFGVFMQSIMMVYTFVSCVSFMILAGDFFSGEDGIPQGLCETNCDSGIMTFFESRFNAVLIVTCLILYPLSSLRNLSALWFTSLLSMFGMLYLLGMLIYEYSTWKDGLPGPDEIEVFKPQLDIFAAAPIVNVAFIAHYNVPRFYQEMKHRTIPEFSKSVGISLSICGLVYIAVAIFGYLIFGDATLSNVLKNFDKEYLPATYARVGMAAVVLFTYPLAFNSLRASTRSLLKVVFPNVDYNNGKNKVILDVSLVLATFIPGSVLTNIGIVLEYKGAILGGMISYAFPAWIFLARMHPESVQFCCYKPLALTSIDMDGNQPLLPPSELTTPYGRSIFLKRLAFIFFAWALLSGIMGVVMTTIGLIH